MSLTDDEPTDEDFDQGDEFPEMSAEEWDALIDTYLDADEEHWYYAIHDPEDTDF